MSIMRRWIYRAKNGKVSSFGNCLKWVGVEVFTLPTKSYTRFINNMETVERLNQTYHQIRKARGGKGKGAFDHVTRSAIIFLASSFEVYIEDVIKECCNQHITFANNAANLPNNIKSTLNQYVKKDSNKTPPSELCDEGWRKVYREITDKQTGALNTPKKIQIAALFNDLIGISKEDINNLQDIDKLDDVIKFRGEIAHRVRADVYVRISQVEENTTIIMNLSKGIDRVIMQYFKATYPGKRLPWNDTY